MERCSIDSVQRLVVIIAHDVKLGATFIGAGFNESIAGIPLNVRAFQCEDDAFALCHCEHARLVLDLAPGRIFAVGGFFGPFGESFIREFAASPLWKVKIWRASGGGSEYE